jgi:hypothetical protein
MGFIGSGFRQLLKDCRVMDISIGSESDFILLVAISTIQMKIYVLNVLITSK